VWCGEGCSTICYLVPRLKLVHQQRRLCSGHELLSASRAPCRLAWEILYVRILEDPATSSTRAIDGSEPSFPCIFSSTKASCFPCSWKIQAQSMLRVEAVSFHHKKSSTSLLPLQLHLQPSIPRCLHSKLLSLLPLQLSPMPPQHQSGM
jgi:hypothetical protein